MTKTSLNQNEQLPIKILNDFNYASCDGEYELSETRDFWNNTERDDRAVKLHMSNNDRKLTCFDKKDGSLRGSFGERNLTNEEAYWLNENEQLPNKILNDFNYASCDGEYELSETRDFWNNTERDDRAVKLHMSNNDRKLTCFDKKDGSLRGSFGERNLTNNEAKWENHNSSKN